MKLLESSSWVQTKNKNCVSGIKKTVPRTSLVEPNYDVAEVEELSEPEFTDRADSAGYFTSFFSAVFYGGGSKSLKKTFELYSICIYLMYSFCMFSWEVPVILEMSVFSYKP